MALPNDLSIEVEGVEEMVPPRVRRHLDWIGPDGDFDPKHLRWVSNYRDWQDIRGDLLSLLRKPLDVAKGWWGP